MEPTVVFGLSPADLRDAAIFRACRELGLRIGLPFRIAPLDSERADAELLIARNPGHGPHIAELGKNGRQIFGPRAEDGSLDVIAGAAHLLSFQHEIDAKRDHMGRINAQDNPLAAMGLLDEPLLEQMSDHLFISHVARHLEKVQRRRAFGAGKRVACLTHDTDSPQLYTPFQMARSLALSAKRRDQWVTFRAGVKGLLTGQPDPYWNFDDWVSLATEAGGQSTIYVYPGTTDHSPRHKRDPRYDPSRPHFRRTLSKLAANGTEIGLHHAINTDSEAGYRAATERMHDICGVMPVGARAHYWKINWNDPHKSWSTMRRSGLDYDTSLSPLDLGYRAGTSLPIFGGQSTSENAPLVVLPTSVMDWYAEPRVLSEVSKAHARLASLIDDSANHGMIVLNWHIRTLTNLGSWARLGDLARSVLANLSADSNTRFLTARDISTLWRAHAKVLERTPAKLIAYADQQIS